MSILSSIAQSLGRQVHCFADSAASEKREGAGSIRTIHAVFCSHLDIGYTGTADQVELGHKEAVDQAIALCRKYPDYRYAVEVTWILREWLKRTDDRELVKELVRFVKEGRIEVCGIHTTMHSAVAGPDDLCQMTYEARRLSEELGIEIVSGIQNDVPGYPWAFPQILSKSGIKYLFTGINTILSGGLKIPINDMPFYWEGIDGSRVMLFVQDGYCWPIHKRKFFKNFCCNLDFAEGAQDLLDFVKELEDGGYPYDSFLFMSSPGDNCPPSHSEHFRRAAERWNAERRMPRIEISTPRRYFEDIKARYGERIPVYRGEWPASFEWDLVKERGPMSTTYYRRLQTQLPTAEKLLSLDAILNGHNLSKAGFPHASYPRHDIEKCYEGLLLYGEHSAPEGHGDAGRLTRREFFWANQEHHGYASRAFHRAETLVERGRMQLAGWAASEDQNRIVVFNPLSWKRTDTVRVPRTIFRFNFHGQHSFSHLRDLATGEIVPCDNIMMSELGGDGVGFDQWPCVSFLAKDVPGFGYRIYEAIREPIPTEDPDVQIAQALPAMAGAAAIENEKYRVEVDRATGDIVSLFDKELNREIVQTQAGDGSQARLNAVKSNFDVAIREVSVTRVEGKTFQRLEIRRPGTWFPETDIRLDRGQSRVEITNVIDRAAWKAAHPRESKWMIHLQFPLRLNAERSKLAVSGPIGFRRIPEDLLPGVPDNTYPTSAFLSVDDGETNVVIASPTDYLFMPGEKQGELVTLQSQILWQQFEALTRSNGLQILPYTEPEEEGRFVRRYAIMSSAGSFDAHTAQQFGWGFRSEMIGAYAPAKPEAKAVFSEAVKPLVQIGDPDVSIATIRRSLFPKQDFFILRLQEIAGSKARKVKIQFAPELRLQWAAQADMQERKGKKIKTADNGFSVKIGPFETVTVALGFEQDMPV